MTFVFVCPLTRYTVRMGGIVSVDWSLGDPLYDDHVCKGGQFNCSIDFSIGFDRVSRPTVENPIENSISQLN